MNSSGQTIIVCKNCGSNKISVKSNASTGCALSAIGLGIASFGMWIPIIGWFILIPIGLVLFFCGFLLPITKRTITTTCQECKYTFEISKNKYKRYKRYLNS